MDGIHPLNLGYILEDNRMALLPNTPQAVLEMLAYYEVAIIGKDVVVIGSLRRLFSSFPFYKTRQAFVRFLL